MMPAENLAEMKNEVEKGFQFLATLRHGGDVYAILKPIFDNLQAKVLEEDIQQRTLADAESVKLLVRNGAPTSEDHEFIVISVHKAMCAEKFICIVEKPSSVPGFAAPIRGEGLPRNKCTNLLTFIMLTVKTKMIQH